MTARIMATSGCTLNRSGHLDNFERVLLLFEEDIVTGWATRSTNGVRSHNAHTTEEGFRLDLTPPLVFSAFTQRFLVATPNTVTLNLNYHH